MSLDDHDPCELPARVQAERLRQGKLSAVALLEAHLQRIERHEELGAVVSMDVDGARRAAQAADAALARGEVRGPLHGLPMTLKDAHDVAGLRTTIGSPRFDRVADEDGTVAARLRGAGAILFGHTNVAPMLADYQSDNELFGRTSNPWDLTRTAGGSGGGAAAAVAMGLTPLEVGSDLGSSLRVPAHFCGVYSLKTTEHRISLHGFFRPPQGGARPVRILSSLGPVARDLGDLALALALLSGPDGHDSDVPPVPLGPRRDLRLQELRLAWADTLPGVAVAHSLRQRVEQVATEARREGASVEQRLPQLDWDELSSLFLELLLAVTGAFEPGTEPRTLPWYLTALHRRDHFVSLWERYFEDVDALILPPTPTAAFPHGDQATSMESGRMGVFCNLAGLPALSVPAGLHQGLPIGVQLVGPRWSEPRLLEIARALEQAGILPGFQRPTYVLGMEET
jgi:amidase